jgi:hypothetical protein
MNWEEAAALLMVVPSHLQLCRSEFGIQFLHAMFCITVFDFLQKLLNHSKCAALISTHFHNLISEIPPALATPMHMSAIVDEASASVTFLYKLVQGCRFFLTLLSIFMAVFILRAVVNRLVSIVPLLQGYPNLSSQV